jgi:hypothetical protein
MSAEPSQWLTATIDIDRTPTEFAGDDVDQYSDLVTMGGIYRYAMVIIPALTSATISICIQPNPLIATVPVAINKLDDDATGHFLHATTAGTGSIAVVFEIGGAEYLRIKASANQAADRTFYIRGFN